MIEKVYKQRIRHTPYIVSTLPQISHFEVGSLTLQSLSHSVTHWGIKHLYTSQFKKIWKWILLLWSFRICISNVRVLYKYRFTDSTYSKELKGFINILYIFLFSGYLCVGFNIMYRKYVEAVSAGDVLCMWDIKEGVSSVHVRVIYGKCTSSYYLLSPWLACSRLWCLASVSREEKGFPQQ